MSVTPISLTDSIDGLWSTTMRKYRRTLVDNTFLKQVLLMLLDKKGRKVYEDGGYQIAQPIIAAENGTVGSFSRYDPVDITPQDEFLTALFDWKFVSGAVAISSEEILKNSGDSAIIKLLEAKIEVLEKSMQKQINTMLFATGGSTSKDIDGLQLIVDTTPATGTYGGLNRATYTFWQNYANASVGSFVTGGLAAMTTAYVNVADGPDVPDIIITDPTTWTYYHAALLDMKRIITENENVAKAGWKNIEFMGIPVVFDRLCTAGYMYFLNTDYLKFVVHRDGEFKDHPFVIIPEQHAKVSKTLFCGNLVATRMNCHGVLAGITA